MHLKKQNKPSDKVDEAEGAKVVAMPPRRQLPIAMTPMPGAKPFVSAASLKAWRVDHAKTT